MRRLVYSVADPKESECTNLFALSDLLHVTVDAMVKDRRDLPDPDQAGHME